MARYLDSWVLHKTLYDATLQGGSCVCISCVPMSPTFFLPVTSVDTVVESLSDLETDDVEGEKTFYKSTFPTESSSIIDGSKDTIFSEDFWRAVWNDRIQLRLRLKRDSFIYSQFFSSLEHDADEPPKIQLLKWFQQNWTLHDLQQFFQVPQSVVHQLLRDKYKLVKDNHLDLFLPSIMEQMEQFQLTRYPLDARGKEEMDFEKELQIHSSLFFLSVTSESLPSEEKKVDPCSHMKMVETTIDIFIQMMGRLGNPILLEKQSEESSSHVVDPNKKNFLQQNQYPCFRYDRRIIRLVVARYWADGIIERWIKFKCFKN